MLIDKQVISSDNKILDEESFLEFLFGLFIYYLTFERYKTFLFDAIDNQKDVVENNKKPRILALPTYQFRFIGLGNKTLFAGDVQQPHLFFPDHLGRFFYNFHQITIVEPFLDKDIIENESWKLHDCTKNYYKRFCERCKNDFIEFSKDKHDQICKAFGIKSYLVLNIDSDFFKELVSQENTVELGEDIEACKCRKHIRKDWNFCPYCSNPVDKSIFEREMPNNPEKMFNEALGLYISLKKGFPILLPNHSFDLDFENEIDIYLQKGLEIILIETTTKIDLDKDYVRTKVKTFNLIDTSIRMEAELQKTIYPPKCSMIIWSINKPSELNDLKNLSSKFFPCEKFKIITSDYKMQKTNKLVIDQDELTNIQESFYKILSDLLKI